MSVNGGTLFPLPEADSHSVCKRLGLALGNASMYGMEHAVTAASQAAAYDCLVCLLDLYGDIEWSMSDDVFLLNGKPVDAKGTAQTLVDQMRRANLHNFAFCAPLDRREFGAFMAILAAEPGAALIADGVDAALARAGFKSIRVDKAVYARVGCRETGKKRVERTVPAVAAFKSTPSGSLPVTGKGVDSGKGRVFDLDSEFLAADGLGMTDGDKLGACAPGGLDMAMTVQAASYVEQRNEIRKQHAAMLAVVRDCAGDPARLAALREQMLSGGLTGQEWQSLLRESGVAEAGVMPSADAPLKNLLQQIEQLAVERDVHADNPQAMSHALEAIGREVDLLIRNTRGKTATLAQRVDADRGTVAEVERQARARGVGLQLSREELLEHLAEINQELVQPLTTSSALLQLLKSGKAGEIPAAQRDIIQTAFDGMERLEKLVGYLQRISGFPAELSPDHELLDEVYGGR